MKKRAKRVYAYGGLFDGLDEDQAQEIQDNADQQGISIDDLISGDGDADDSSGGESDGDEDDTTEYAYGGRAAANINVEGGEVIDAPNMPVMKVRGAKHEQGGVNVAVPPGTKIFSDRLKVGGRTMQERKLIREGKIAKIEAALGDNGILSRNTADRTKAPLEEEETKDMMLQKVANTVMEQPKEEPLPQAGYGYEVPYFGQDTLNQLHEIDGLQNRQPGLRVPTNNVTYTPSAGVKPIGTNMTLGDDIGIGANIVGAIAPFLNSAAAARATRPVLNRYRGVGQRAIDANTTAQDNVAGQQTDALTDVNTSINTAFANNRNRSGSLNTLRANDAVTVMGQDKVRSGIRAKFSGLMDGLLSERGRLTNYQDQMQAQGQTQADYATQANIDNYYTNKGQDIANFATQGEGLARNLNQSYQNKVDANVMHTMSRYGLTFDENGNLISR